MAVLRDASLSTGVAYFAAVQSAAPSLGVELTAANAQDAGEIERAVTEFARALNSGLIVTGAHRSSHTAS